eukprot:8756398-Pyramimonas_sp.AAC.1
MRSCTTSCDGAPPRNWWRRRAAAPPQEQGAARGPTSMHAGACACLSMYVDACRCLVVRRKLRMSVSACWTGKTCETCA